MRRSTIGIPRRALRAGCAVLLSGGALAAQAGVEFVPVGDLLESRWVREPYLAPVLVDGRRLLLGEQEWVGSEFDWDWEGPQIHRQQPAWFDGDQLCWILSQLLERDAGEFRLLAKQDVIAVDSRLASPVRAALSELRQRLPPVVHFDVELLRTEGPVQRVLLRRAVDCASGRRTWISDLDQTTALLGYEVEIAQGAQVASPVVRPVALGAMTVVRPFVSPVDSTMWLDLLVRIAEPTDVSPLDLGHPGFGALDRAARRVRELAGVVPARLGETVVQSWTGADGVRCDLRLSMSWPVAAPVRPGGHEFEYLPDWSRFTGCRSVPWMPFEQKDLDDEQERATSGLIDQEGLAVHEAGATGLIGLDTAADALRRLTSARYAAAPPIALEVAVYDAADGAALDGFVPAGGRLLGRAELRTVVGAWVTATAFEDLSVLRTWNVEVAQSARIPRPQCRRLPTGLFLNLRCSADQVELDGEWSWRSGLEGREVVLDTPMGSPPASDARKSGDRVYTTDLPGQFLPQDVVRLEQVRVHTMPLSARLPLRAEKPGVVRQAGVGLEAGRELVVVVRRLGE